MYKINFILSYLGEKSLVDVNTFQLIFHELLTLFLTWLNQKRGVKTFSTKKGGEDLKKGGEERKYPLKFDRSLNDIYVTNLFD